MLPRDTSMQARNEYDFAPPAGDVETLLYLQPLLRLLLLLLLLYHSTTVQAEKGYMEDIDMHP